MLPVPVVRGVCFLSGLKNTALKCLRTADYFSVFLCHTNSSALVGKTAPVLSFEACFYNWHRSCVVLAGLCEGKVWRGHGERLQRALARQACLGHTRGRVAQHWCSGWVSGGLGLCLHPGLLGTCPRLAAPFTVQS